MEEEEKGETMVEVKGKGGGKVGCGIEVVNWYVNEKKYHKKVVDYDSFSPTATMGIGQRSFIETRMIGMSWVPISG